MSEQETITLVNDEDLKDGFFQIYTSNPLQAVRIKRSYEGHILKEEQTTHQGKITSWDFQIGIVMLPKDHFLRPKCLRRAVLAKLSAKARGNLSPPQLKAQKERSHGSY
jgi:hypothetical protein